MSSTSSTIGRRRGGCGVGGQKLIYENKYCDCNKIAMIKIEMSMNSTKGRLYQVCQLGICEFFSWCEPIQVGSTSVNL